MPNSNSNFQNLSCLYCWVASCGTLASSVHAEVTGQKTGHCWTLLHYISLPCGIISLSWASWFGAFQTHKHDWRPFTTSTVSESRPVENFLGAKGPQATASFGKTIDLVKMEATQSNRFSTCRLDPRRDRVKMVKEQGKEAGGPWDSQAGNATMQTTSTAGKPTERWP